MQPSSALDGGISSRAAAASDQRGQITRRNVSRGLRASDAGIVLDTSLRQSKTLSPGLLKRVRIAWLLPTRGELALPNAVNVRGSVLPLFSIASEVMAG